MDPVGPGKVADSVRNRGRQPPDATGPQTHFDSGHNEVRRLVGHEWDMQPVTLGLQQFVVVSMLPQESTPRQTRQTGPHVPQTKRIEQRPHGGKVA